jgi:DNA-binding XRE family transcriptional regulator
MMALSVTVLTEREPLAHRWQQALTKHDIDVHVVAPSDLANAVSNQVAVVVDVDGPALDSDELLATLAFIRASGAIPVAHVDRDREALEDIVEELCHGLVTTDDQDIALVAAAIPRRADTRRHLRFEFVTVSPAGDDVLALLGDGHASLHRRPIDASDDGTPIVSITIDPTATKATMLFESGATSQLTVAHTQASGMTNGGVDIAIDGEKLGARLRELRLAAGLTQAELARRTGIHRPNIARVEAGRHTPSLETLARIANAIGVSTTHVLVSRES